MQDHGVVVETLSAQTLCFIGDMGAEMHVSRVPPNEEWLAVGMGLANEFDGAVGDVVVNCLHPFLVSGPVSSMTCLPIRPKRGSIVGLSTSDALECMTPRGPKRARNAGSFG